jgi:polar amino acid transport system substrate-binding protein
MKRLSASLASLGAALAFALAMCLTTAPAVAGELKCEPDKLAAKYPSLVGKTIKIGQDGESPPYSFRDPKDFQHLIGLDADMARTAFACAGVPVEFFTGGWSGLLPAVVAGQADVMWDTLYYTPERAKQIDYVIYMTAATGGLVAKGNPKKITSLDEVCGMRATAGLGTVEETAFRNLSAKCTTAGKDAIDIVTYPDMPGGTRLIQTGRADILMSDLGMVNRLVAMNPGAFERGFMMVTDYKVGVGLTKGNKDLAAVILDGLLIMKADGTDKALFAKYNVDYALARSNEILTK